MVDSGSNAGPATVRWAGTGSAPPPGSRGRSSRPSRWSAPRPGAGGPPRRARAVRGWAGRGAPGHVQGRVGAGVVHQRRYLSVAQHQHRLDQPGQPGRAVQVADRRLLWSPARRSRSGWCAAGTPRRGRRTRSGRPLRAGAVRLQVADGVGGHPGRAQRAEHGVALGLRTPARRTRLVRCRRWTRRSPRTPASPSASALSSGLRTTAATPLPPSASASKARTVPEREIVEPRTRRCPVTWGTCRAAEATTMRSASPSAGPGRRDGRTPGTTSRPWPRSGPARQLSRWAARRAAKSG